ncbi:MAG: rod shape-determining protein MreC [Syntrophomonadaceae bacterium]|nr:rod shape-determining protein MreC [Syntrophomonadaceae bacterium]
MLKVFKNKYFWLVGFLIIITFLSINMTSSDREDISGIEKMLRNLYTPLQSGVSEFRVNLGNFTTVFNNKKTLNDKIKTLEQENRRISLDNQILRENQAELKRLRDIVAFKEASLATYDLLPARVISRSPNNWYQTLVIDKGSNAGVKKGMTVITPKGLVGSVGSVGHNSAHINLITDREVAVGAILQENRDTSGIIEGRGDRTFLGMINVPYYSTVKKNNRVITSGLSLTFPKGIFIGTVSEITRERGGLLMSASVKPAVDFDKLEEVLIITDYHPVDDSEENMGE